MSKQITIEIICSELQEIKDLIAKYERIRIAAQNVCDTYMVAQKPDIPKEILGAVQKLSDEFTATGLYN